MPWSTPASEQVYVLPTVHGSVEFAAAIRLELDELRPDVVAVELPSTLAREVDRAVSRLPLLSVVRYASDDGRPVYLLVEPHDSIVEALRWAKERGVETALVDLDQDGVARVVEPLPDPYSLLSIGYRAYVDAYLEARAGVGDPTRERAMAYRVSALAEAGRRVALVCGLAHARGVLDALGEPLAEPFGRRRRSGVEVLHLSLESSREVMSEPPYVAAGWEEARRAEVVALPDRRRMTTDLLLAARDAYRADTGDDVSLSRLEVLERFMRNWSLLEGRLSPDLYQLVVSARAAVDDDYSYHVWQAATDYPHQTDHPELPVLELRVEDLFEHSRLIRFRRTWRRRRRRLLRLVKPRPKEKYPGQWAERWRGQGVCSYPPEDLRIEGYSAFLRKKAVGILSSENSRVEPFTSSLLDGIDVRETIRNWHEGRLYVREHQRVRGKVGAVVIIFDAKDEAGKYPWRLTWQGEHEDESDMALYATPPEAHLVGPGIARCEYGGFVMTYPPGRMFMVWEDDWYRAVARTPAEVMLLAGLEYSQDRMVLYVAQEPPRSLFKTLAARMRRKIVYIPIGQLSPVTLKQIRVFHVLDGWHVRSYASSYIW